MTSKRRHYDRVSMALPFCMHIQRNTFLGKTFNISMNGVYASVTEGDINHLGSGLIGKCQLTMNQVHVTLDCQIIRVCKQELAVVFTEIGAEKFNLLRALLACGSYAKDVILAHCNDYVIPEDRSRSLNYSRLVNMVN